MARRQRDYRAEQARRIRNGLAKGLTRSQARGHAKAGETPASKIGNETKRVKPDPTLEGALLSMRNGTSLTTAAKEAHVSRERLASYIRTYAGAFRKGNLWDFDDSRRRRILFLESSKTRYQVGNVRGYHTAKLAGQHYDDARQLLKNPDQLALFQEKWAGKSLTDVRGNVHALSTDYNEISRMLSSDEPDWSRIYKIYMQ